MFMRSRLPKALRVVRGAQPFARLAGEVDAERVVCGAVRPRPGKREPHTGEDRQVDAERDLLAAPDARRRDGVSLLSLPKIRSTAARPR